MIVAAVAASGAGVTAAVAASAIDDAQAMVQRGDYDGALKKLDDFLSVAPQDPDARFERGVVLPKLNRTQDAIKAFTDLTHDYPKLPEPYNNLAVIYAQEGQYEKARDELESALATAPSYATAHENLGDVYAALASAAYNRALMLDKNNQAVRYKLSLINRLNSAGPSVEAKSPTSVAAASAQGASTTSSSAASSMSSSAPSTAAAPAAAHGEGGAPSTAAQTAGVSSATRAAAIDLVQSWAKAWAAQDVGKYLSYYSADFDPADGLSHAEWEKQRRERLSKPSRITIHVHRFTVSRIDPTHLRITFQQDYRAPGYKDHMRKALDLGENGGELKITREYAVH
jgi:tetratricopeptide (TPR) repeat protein